MSHYQSCVLCGVEGPQVRIALVEWAAPQDDKPYQRFAVIPRCSDVRDCRQRVEQLGDEWLLAEPKARGGRTAK
jgi:hypothetical protein